MATQQSSWADLQNDPRTQLLKKLGAQALASGAVSKEDALQNAQSLGIPMVPGASAPTQPVQVSDISMTPPKPQGDLDMTAMDMYNQQGMGDASNRLGVKLGAVKQNTQNFKHSSTRFNQFSPDQTRAMQLQARGIYPHISGYEQATDESGNPQFDASGQPVYDKDRPIHDFDSAPDSVDEQNPVRMQEKGLDKMQALLGMDAEYQKNKNHMDFTPIAALADAQNASRGNPTNLAASMKAPENNNNFMAYADEIQKRRADIQKSITEGIKAQKSGSTMDMLTQAMLDKTTAGQNNPVRDYNQQMEMQKLRAQDAQAARAHQQILNKLSNDKQLQTELQTYNGLGTGLSVIQNAKNITPQIVDEAQQAIKQAMQLGRGNGGGVGEREKTYMNSVGLTADRLQQFLSGKPSDIANNDEIVQHLRNLAAIEQGNVQTMFGRRLNAVSAGAGWVYNNPRYQPGGEGMDFSTSLQDALSAQHGQLPGSGATVPQGGQKAIRKVTTAPSNVQKNNQSPAAAAVGAETKGAALPSMSDIDAEIARRKGQ